MAFSKIKEWFIPQGKVESVAINGKTVWQAKKEIEQLTAPAISLDGDTLTITATDDRTKEFVIFVDGVEIATVANENAAFAFTIDGTTYYAKSGMTWGEWIESEYNTGGFVVSGTRIWDAVGYIETQGGMEVKPIDTVIADVTYSIVNMQIGGSPD